MNTGFSTSEPDEKKQQNFLSGNAISLTYEEPENFNMDMLLIIRGLTACNGTVLI